MNQLRQSIKSIKIHAVNYGDGTADEEYDYPVPDKVIDAILDAVIAALPELNPASTIDVLGGDGNRDDCIEFGHDIGYNEAVRQITATLKSAKAPHQDNGEEK